MRPTAAILALALGACTTSSEVIPAAASVVELARDSEVTRLAAGMPSGEYTLDARHTSVLWRVRHWGLSPYTGRFDTVSGQLVFDAANPAASTVSVRIPLASVSTGILNREGQRAFDRDIAAYLGADANPDIVFESRSIELTGATTGRITGDLSFNGRTHPVTLDANFEGGRVIPTNNRPTLAFTARTIFRRSQWLEGTPPLHNSASPGDEIEIIITAEFARPAAQQPQAQPAPTQPPAVPPPPSR
jgi:polyisoprenoid-binding protein YceI